MKITTKSLRCATQTRTRALKMQTEHYRGETHSHTHKMQDKLIVMHKTDTRQ